MAMDDEKLKRLLQEDMDKDVENILEEVNSDLEIRDVVAPEVIHERLFKQIREHEAMKAEEVEELNSEDENTHDTSELSEEQQELIRLGKIYKKKRSRRKYWVIAVAVVCALALGITSFGGAEKVFKEVKDMIAGKSQTHVDTDENRTDDVQIVSEEEAYEKIDEEFGVYPVRFLYLPEGMEFVELVIEEDLQFVQLCYENNEGEAIAYRIVTSHRTGSVGVDVEDKLLNEYEIENKGNYINIKEYEVEGNEVSRWLITFEYENVQYWLQIMDMQEDEVKKIVENLYFS